MSTDEDIKIYKEIIQKFNECQEKDFKHTRGYKKVYKMANDLLNSSSNLSDEEKIELYIIKGNINDDIRENLDAAIKEYKKALKIDSANWSIWYNLGVSYGRKGEADLAISIYKKVINLNPNFSSAFYNRGIQQMVKGNFNLACEDWHKCQEIRGYDENTTELLEKYCLHDKEDHEYSKPEITPEAEIDPDAWL